MMHLASEQLTRGLQHLVNRAEMKISLGSWSSLSLVSPYEGRKSLSPFPWGSLSSPWTSFSCLSRLSGQLASSRDKLPGSPSQGEVVVTRAGWWATWRMEDGGMWIPRASWQDVMGPRPQWEWKQSPNIEREHFDHCPVSTHLHPHLLCLEDMGHLWHLFNSHLDACTRALSFFRTYRSKPRSPSFSFPGWTKANFCLKAWSNSACSSCLAAGAVLFSSAGLGLHGTESSPIFLKPLQKQLCYWKSLESLPRCTTSGKSFPLSVLPFQPSPCICLLTISCKIIRAGLCTWAWTQDKTEASGSRNGGGSGEYKTQECFSHFGFENFIRKQFCLLLCWCVGKLLLNFFIFETSESFEFPLIVSFPPSLSTEKEEENGEKWLNWKIMSEGVRT